MLDLSNGYEEHAETFLRSRNPRIGQRVVREWALQFSKGAEVLELGCGHGVVSQALIESGVTLFTVDASPTLLSAFRERFPNVETDCSTAEESRFFGREFDGVVAWGLLFLMEEQAQRDVLGKAAKALRPSGRLLFTAPFAAMEWNDAMTGLPSRSLGAETYHQLMREAGLEIAPGITDEGENYYYLASKQS